jgi:hypothetical protein
MEFNLRNLNRTARRYLRAELARRKRLGLPNATISAVLHDAIIAGGTAMGLPAPGPACPCRACRAARQ